MEDKMKQIQIDAFKNRKEVQLITKDKDRVFLVRENISWKYNEYISKYFEKGEIVSLDQIESMHSDMIESGFTEVTENFPYYFQELSGYFNINNNKKGI